MNSLRGTRTLPRAGWTVASACTIAVMALTASCGSGSGGGATSSTGGADASVSTHGASASGTENADSTGSGESLSFRWAWGLPDTAPSSKQAVAASEDIEEQSGGSIKVVTYPAGALFSEDDLPGAVGKGQVEVATTSLHRWENVAPALAIDTVPFLFTGDMDEEQAVDNAWKIAGGQFEQDLNAILASHNAVIIGWGFYGFDGDMANSKHAIEDPSDLKGLRMRSNGAQTTALFEKYGAVGEPLDSSDVYAAMQRGAIDGAYSGLGSIISRKWYEVGKYVTAMHSGLTYNPIFANKKWWDGLSPDQQSLIKDSIESTQSTHTEDILQQDKDALDTLKQNGNEVVEVTGDLREQWRDATEFEKDSYLDSAGEDGKKLMADVEAAMAGK